MGDLIVIEVVDARSDLQSVVTLQVSPATTLHQAALQSGLLTSTAVPPLGVFGRVCAPDTQVCAGDRVEIYRPLINDPKQARRRRAELSR